MSLPGSAPNPRLPSHWQRGRRTAALVMLVLVSLAMLALLRGGRTDGIGEWWLRARFTTRARLVPPHPDPDIVLVNVDDRTSDQWPDEPLLGWGKHFADAIDRLHLSGARVIALDFTHAVPAERSFPGSDEAMARALNAAGNVVMIKFRREAEHGGPSQWVLPAPQLLFSLPDVATNVEYDLGDAGLGDQSEVVAATPIEKDPPQNTHTFAARVVEHYLGGPGRIERGAYVIPGKLRVPLRSDGTLLVNYAGSGEQPTFQRYSLIDIIKLPRRPDPRFRNKIVIIGMTFAGSNDISYIPFMAGATGSQSCNGNEIQANIVHTLLTANPIREPGAPGIWLLAMALSLVGLCAFYLLPLRAAALVSVLAAVLWGLISLAVFILWSYSLPVALPFIGIAISAFGLGIYRGFREEGERREVMNLWGTYQDPRIVHYLLEHPLARAGEGSETQVTVLFADLKNFTKTVEHLSPSVALQTLNSYLSLMAHVILEHGGLVDKFLGDGLMAQWGVPDPRADHAEAAVHACLDLYQRVRELTGSMLREQDVTFGLRLTLHSGPVVMGVVGASRREFTIIGDTVNVTSRLQETAKELGCEFLISETVYAKVKDWVQIGKQDEVAIRGRLQPLKVYEVLGEMPEASPGQPALEKSGWLTR